MSVGRTTRIVMCALLLSGMLAGCGDSKKIMNGDSNPVPAHAAFGSWPENAGLWRSHRDGAGHVHQDAAYLEIDLAEDGTFTGIYQSYRYSSTIYQDLYLPSGTMRVPIPLYLPSGSQRNVAGALDFDRQKGIATFVGLGTTEFDLRLTRSATTTGTGAQPITRLNLVFPSGFSAYRGAQVDRR